MDFLTVLLDAMLFAVLDKLTSRPLWIVLAEACSKNWFLAKLMGFFIPALALFNLTIGTSKVPFASCSRLGMQ